MQPCWTGPFSGVVLVSMYSYVGLLATVLLSFAFFLQFKDVPIRPNAFHHLMLLGLFFGSYFLAFFIAEVSQGGHRFLANLLINAGATIAFEGLQGCQPEPSP